MGNTAGILGLASIGGGDTGLSCLRDPTRAIWLHPQEQDDLFYRVVGGCSKVRSQLTASLQSRRTAPEESGHPGHEHWNPFPPTTSCPCPEIFHFLNRPCSALPLPTHRPLPYCTRAVPLILSKNRPAAPSQRRPNLE